jgi:hypothetical protein
MQTVGDLVRKNLEAFGERDAEKRRMAISTIWESDGVFVDPHRLHTGPEAIDNAVEHLLLSFRISFSASWVCPTPITE